MPHLSLSRSITLLSSGVFNTNMIISNLKKMRIQTFFGDLEFNAYRRNIAKVPATLQVSTCSVLTNLPDIFYLSSFPNTSISFSHLIFTSSFGS
jgi:hypothetical protein